MTNDARIAEALDFITQSLKEGKAFALEQAPYIAREIVEYHTTSAIVLLSLSVTVFVVFVIAAIWCHVRTWDDDMGKPIAASLLWMCAVICIIPIGINGNDLIRIKTAPRTVILSEINNLRR